MKKTNTMRVAVLLLALALVTSCFVGGTFAKYVTTIEEANDSARVAKWGVAGTVTGGAFAKTYDLDDEVDGEFTLAVESEDKVVAPGTTGTFGGIAITGTPETAVNITTTASLTLTGWEVDGDYYCPIVITVGTTDISGLTYDSAAEFEAAVEAAIIAANGDYEPNTNLANVEGLNGSYTWAWAFNGDDVKDTALGDQAAAGNAATIALAVSAVVTQIN